MNILKTAAAAGIILTATTAMAQDRDDWAFEFRNETGSVVTQINTQRPNGQWSTNWLRARIGAGGRINLSFYNENDTRCEVLTRVTFANDEYYQEVIDYCNKDVLIVTEEAMTAH